MCSSDLPVFDYGVIADIWLARYFGIGSFLFNNKEIYTHHMQHIANANASRHSSILVSMPSIFLHSFTPLFFIPHSINVLNGNDMRARKL